MKKFCEKSNFKTDLDKKSLDRKHNWLVFSIWFLSVNRMRNKKKSKKSVQMKSNTVWKYHLQFLKYFVCQEMNNLIILWKHCFDGKNWFKTNDFLLLLPYSRLKQYTHKLQHPNIATYSEITTFSGNQTKHTIKVGNCCNFLSKRLTQKLQLFS